GQRAQQLGRRVPGPALLEADDVVHAHPGEDRQLLAPQPGRPPAGTRRQPDVLGADTVPPGAQQNRQLVHGSILPSGRADWVVPAVPTTAPTPLRTMEP